MLIDIIMGQHFNDYENKANTESTINMWSLGVCFSAHCSLRGRLVEIDTCAAASERLQLYTFTQGSPSMPLLGE